MSSGRRTVTKYGKAPATKKQAQASQQKRGLPIGPIVGVVVGIALVIAIVLSFGSSDDPPPEFGAPTVTGQPLPQFASGAADAAVGLAAPAVTGADFDGTPVSVDNDGTPKAILFLAHWCPHCQAEVPEVQAWLDAGGVPDGFEFLSVSTSMNSVRENYPPSAWLERERWTAPVIADDEASTVAGAYGLTAFPYWVFIDAEGNVAARWSGALPIAQLDAVISDLTS